MLAVEELVGLDLLVAYITLHLALSIQLSIKSLALGALEHARHCAYVSAIILPRYRWHRCPQPNPIETDEAENGKGPRENPARQEIDLKTQELSEARDPG